jgi:hypothetical protein
MVISIQELRKEENRRQQAFMAEKPGLFPWQHTTQPAGQSIRQLLGQRQPEPQAPKASILKFARYLYEN